MQKILFLILSCCILLGCGGGSDKQNANSGDEKKILLQTLEGSNESVQNSTVLTTDTTSKDIQKSSQDENKTDKKSENISQNTQNVSKATDKTAQKTESVTSTSASLYDLENGKKIFKRCIPCHGAKANLSAVGKSQDISKWSKEDIANALKGYKDGTYGGSTKATMTSLIKILNQKDITDVAFYIEALKN
ncbi:MAG: c-type cytochrome [Campylobacteraceae bacterium]|jgi:cytochrome c553|nr:c-type cytochrome [Campylobacteraceae bacterium]